VNLIDKHPILGQLKESDRQLKDIALIQEAIAERRKILERDGKATTLIAGFVGISGLFFMKPLSFYLILGLLVIGIPLVWAHLKKEAQAFAMTDAEIQDVLNSEN
jgi:hypothetical protein